MTDLEAVQAHQVSPFVHPLTCGGCEERDELPVAELRGTDVWIVCPCCGHEQLIDGKLLDIIKEMRSAWSS